MNTLFYNYNSNLNSYNKHYGINEFIDFCIKSSGYSLGIPILHKLYFHTSLNNQCFNKFFNKFFNLEKPFNFNKTFVQLNKSMNHNIFEKNKKLIDHYLYLKHITPDQHKILLVNLNKMNQTMDHMGILLKQNEDYFFLVKTSHGG